MFLRRWSRTYTRYNRCVTLALVLMCFFESVKCSIGDLSPAYQRCLAQCVAQCPPNQVNSRFALWSCPAECQYDCTQRLTDLALASDPATGGHLQQPGQPLENLAVGSMVQYHGKWPFHRLDYGPIKMQEPLSVLFSLMNLAAHYWGWKKLAKMQSKTHSGLGDAYRLYALSGINTWIWSAVFHTRDVDWTEKADYFSAAGGMLAGLWMAGVRLGGLYRTSAEATSRPVIARTWALACFSVFTLHCIYLSSGPRFDYAYNMQFNVTVALLQIILWACWSAYHQFILTPVPKRDMSSQHPRTQRSRAPHSHLPLIPLLLLPALTALELLDFAPIGPFGLRLLDAHALWHASTAPVVVIWYDFLLKDLYWIEQQQQHANSMPGRAGRLSVEEETSQRRLD